METRQQEQHTFSARCDCASLLEIVTLACRQTANETYDPPKVLFLAAPKEEEGASGLTSTVSRHCRRFTDKHACTCRGPADGGVDTASNFLSSSNWPLRRPLTTVPIHP